MGGAFKRLSRDLAPDNNLNQMQADLAALGGQPKNNKRNDKHRPPNRHPAKVHDRRPPRGTKVIFEEPTLAQEKKADKESEQARRDRELSLYLSTLPAVTTGEARFALRDGRNETVHDNGRVIGFSRKENAKPVRETLKTKFGIETFVTPWVDHWTKGK